MDDRRSKKDEGSAVNPSARWNVLLVLLALVGAAWIWGNRLPVGEAAAANTAGLPPAPAVGHPAPDFTLTAVTGEAVTLAALRGQPVVLNFWATWCPPCRAELPELQAASERLQGEVAIVGVNQAEDAERVRTFVADLSLTFTVPLDERGQVSRAYNVRSLPTTFFIDRNGVIRRIQSGALTEATLAQALESVYP
jgi:cytochrome c biogenesis protein CcmG, thiol:disulfide interchange protein DsbE